MTDWEYLQFALERTTRHQSRLKFDRNMRALKRAYRANGMGAAFDALTPEMRFNLCTARIYHRDFTNWAGWTFRDRWAIEWRLPHSIPMWHGENVDRLLVLGEQGIGDQILWASVLPEAIVRCKHVTYTCDARLISIFERSLPGLACREMDDDNELEGYDAYIGAADLMPLFRQRRSHFPRRAFLRALPRTYERFAGYRGCTGIGWAGRQGAIDPYALGLTRPVSLQHDAPHPCAASPALDLHHDLEGVLGLVANLSEVVAVPSSIVHIAGALGVKASVILPNLPGEIENQIQWAFPPGENAFYESVTTYETIKDWRADTDNWIARDHRATAQA